MNCSKYIIVNDAGEERPIVFSPFLSHSFVAGAKRVVSAGFCDIDQTVDNDDGTKKAISWHVWGESVSLDVKSRPDDANIINEQLRYDY